MTTQSIIITVGQIAPVVSIHTSTIVHTILKKSGFDQIHAMGPFCALLRNENETFRETYARTWKERKDQFFGDLNAFLDSLPNTRDGRGYGPSFTLNSNRWDYAIRESIEEAVSKAKAFLDNRKAELDKLIEEEFFIVGIHDVTVCQPLVLTSTYFSLTGATLDSHTAKKGIYLNNKKKVVVR